MHLNTFEYRPKKGQKWQKSWWFAIHCIIQKCAARAQIRKICDCCWKFTALVIVRTRIRQNKNTRQRTNKTFHSSTIAKATYSEYSVSWPGISSCRHWTRTSHVSHVQWIVASYKVRNDWLDVRQLQYLTNTVPQDNSHTQHIMIWYDMIGWMICTRKLWQASCQHVN